MHIPYCVFYIKRIQFQSKSYVEHEVLSTYPVEFCCYVECIQNISKESERTLKPQPHYNSLNQRYK